MPPLRAVALLVALLASSLPLGGSPPGLSSRPPETVIPTAASEAGGSPLRHALGQRAFAFEANQGQFHPSVDFAVRRGSHSFLLKRTGELVSIVDAPRNPLQVSGARGDRSAYIHMQLLDARARPEVRAAARLPGTTNYLIGNDPQRWQHNVRSYRRVVYEGVYRGIDLIYHPFRSMLEYDFRLRPGADPATIAFRFGGARADIGPDGDLVLHTAAGKIRHRRPVAFQRVAGQRRLVPASYSLDRRRNVTFSLGAYDPTRPLVIDPVVDFATYLGGVGEDSARAVELDDAGNIYVAGVTTSVDFPLKGAADEDNKGDKDVFITKLSPDGSRIIYSTYLGGTGDESGRVPATNTLTNDRKLYLVRVSPVDLAVDDEGKVYVSGVTSSDDFPSVDPPPETARGGGADAFVAMFDVSGARLLASAYLGGRGEDLAYGVDLDPSGDAYVTGRTESKDFPIHGDEADSTCGDDGDCNAASDPVEGDAVAGDAFITRLDLGQSDLVYSSFIGDETDETGYDVVIDGSTAYVAGATVGFGFPCTTSRVPERDCQQSRPPGDKGSVWEVAPTGLVAPFRTVSEAEILRGIARGDDGKTYVVGEAQGQPQAYLAILDPSGSSHVSKALPGGWATAVRVDDDDHVYVTGAIGEPSATRLRGPTFPSHNALQGWGGRFDGILHVLDGQQNSLLATTLGGSDFENATVVRTAFSSIYEIFGSVAIDTSGSILAVGQSKSIDFPWSDPLQADLSGGSDAFVMKIHLGERTGPTVSRVSPRSGPTAGHTKILIQGAGFDGVSAVRFGGVSATSFAVTPDGRSIEAVSPPHETGGVPVTVTTAAGTSQGRFQEARFYYGQGAWTRAGSTSVNRYGHTAALLAGPGCQAVDPPAYCGKVLIAGGRTPLSPPQSDPFWDFDRLRLASMELFDPRTGTWSDGSCAGGVADPTCPAPMNRGRDGHTASPLLNGKVLVVGGDEKRQRVDDPTGDVPIVNEPVGSTAEIYDPATGAWELVDDVPLPRFFHTATLVPPGSPGYCGRACGRLLVAGGSEAPQAYGNGWDSTVLYDGDGKMNAAGTLREGRYLHDAALLQGPPSACGANCGRVLVVGGFDAEGLHSHRPEIYRQPEIYDPLTDTWRTTAPVGVRRVLSTATLLENGQVLVVGGSKDLVNGDGATFPMHVGDSDLFVPGSETWQPTGSLRIARYGHEAVRLPSGKVLVVGGMAAAPLAFAEVYDPQKGRWSSAGSMEGSRSGEDGATSVGWGLTATLLSSNAHEFEADPDVCGDNCGKVLVVGGSHEPFAELYTPEPTVDTLSPVSSATSGTTVTLTGTGFTHELREVRFGDSSVACPSPACTINSYSRVTVTAPSHEPGVVDVSVVNEGGESEVGDATKFTYLASPGVVKDLKAEALSGKEIKLTFSAPAALGSTQTPQQPAQRYVIKQSRSPITDEPGFAGASALCGGTCTFEPPIANVGDQVSLTVKELSPNTTYHYALKVIDDSTTVGPLSDPASATTKATTPGTVTDLRAAALSRSSIELSFSAVGSDGNEPPPLGDYVIKQSASPITDERAFDAARPLCEHACHFEPTAVGDGLTLTVTDLAPATTYHYALRAKAPQGDLGALSNPASATTRQGPRPDDDGKEETKALQRKVTLRLKGHLVASGRVRSDGAAACRNNVRVVIQRNSRKIRTVSTSKAGRFKVRLPDRGGVYRAVVAKTRSGSNLCGHAASQRRRHRH